MCPYGYRGNKCETHEFLDDENGKNETNFNLSKSCAQKAHSFVFIYTPIECNLSRDSSATADDSIDSFDCASKCLNELNNIELCRCHQNNEIGKQKTNLQFASTVVAHCRRPRKARRRCLSYFKRNDKAQQAILQSPALQYFSCFFLFES